jgi:hypothetical protein
VFRNAILTYMQFEIFPPLNLRHQRSWLRLPGMFEGGNVRLERVQQAAAVAAALTLQRQQQQVVCSNCSSNAASTQRARQCSRSRP